MPGTIAHELQIDTMIVFDLRCADGHRFESWFQSGAVFDRQQAEGAIECPLCGSHAIAKAPMAPHIAHAAEAAGEKEAVAGGGPPAEMREALRRLRRHIEELRLRRADVSRGSTPHLLWRDRKSRHLRRSKPE
jgi:hypothetical protein